jgi:hypothetical protein
VGREWCHSTNSDQIAGSALADVAFLEAAVPVFRWDDAIAPPAAPWTVCKSGVGSKTINPTDDE